MVFYLRPFSLEIIKNVIADFLWWVPPENCAKHMKIDIVLA